MSQANLAVAGTFTSNTTSVGFATGGGIPCFVHGQVPCTCGPIYGNTQCLTCGQYYNPSLAHSCTYLPTTLMATCLACGQSYQAATGHYCSGRGYNPNTWPVTWTTGTTTLLNGHVFGPSFKEIKEITTDIELKYEYNESSFNIHLPAKFGDCFLKVGYKWLPLYPLIFSALENDETTISFHLVFDVMDKVYDGDNIILKGVTTTKIEDNLTLVQLTSKVREHFKEEK